MVSARGMRLYWSSALSSALAFPSKKPFWTNAETAGVKAPLLLMFVTGAAFPLIAFKPRTGLRGSPIEILKCASAERASAVAHNSAQFRGG